MNKPLCIYHGKCIDGFTAAWAVNKAHGGNVEFVEAKYGDPAPAIGGRDVIIVDFSYPRDVMEWIISNAKSLIVLDHHKTAEAELDGLDKATEDVHVEFDMKRSGAGMAWDHFFSHRDRPMFLSYVEDRDLWNFNLPDSKAVNAALQSYHHRFEIWDILESTDIEDLIVEGIAIRRKQNKDTEEVIASTKTRMIISSIDVPVACVPHFMASDAGHIMAKGEAFSATYYDDADGDRIFSLRSDNKDPNAADVSQIAREHGGGGHKNAAGFKVKLAKIKEI